MSTFHSGFAGHMSVLRSAGVLVQSNAEHFTGRLSSRRAVKSLAAGEIDFVGSDCHNMSSRAPNMAAAAKKAPKIAKIDISAYLTIKS